MDPIRAAIDDLQRLSEAGRVLSGANEAKVRTAIASLHSLLAQLETAYGAEETAEAKEALREARALLMAEAKLSHDQIRSSLHSALRAAHPGNVSTYPVDVFDKDVVYRQSQDGDYSSKLMKRPYTLGADNAVTLGDPSEVQAVTSYEPVLEAGVVDLPAGLLVRLEEKSVRRDGTAPLKIISAGWGTSGYYSPEVLKRDGPKVFRAGLHMYLDHPTLAEQADRPERSLKDLAGVLESDARWNDNGADGPGLYADAKLRSDYAPLIEELAPHIGVSIRALGVPKLGTAEGRNGQIVERIASAKSVDFVTLPGRGGKVLQLTEAARGRVTTAPTTPATPAPGQETDQVDPKDLTEARSQLAEAQTALATAQADNARAQADNARLQEAATLRTARDFVSARLAKSDLPSITQTRLTDSLAKSPTLKDGNQLDEAAFGIAIDEAAKAEVEYLAKATGAGSGAIRGMGGSSASTTNSQESEALLESAFARILGTGSTAKIAAKGRA